MVIMKKTMIILAAAAAFLTSCGLDTSDTGSKTAVTGPVNTETPTEAAAEEEAHYSRDGHKLLIDMSQFSENAKLLTAVDIYLDSFDCGYMSEAHPDRLIIDTQEQLDTALEYFGLALPPDGLTKDELWYYETAISAPFNRMKEEYPIADYTYVIEYEEVGCSGYDFHAGALLVDENTLFFVKTDQSRWPDPDEAQCDVMGGFCYMAAVPKGTLMSESYERWEYPQTPVVEDVVSPLDTGSDTIEDGYIAVFHGGVGERTHQTYVYQDAEGYRYVNATSTTVRWGSPMWRTKIDDSGKKETKEEIVSVAERNGADQFVTFTDERKKIHTIDDFLGQERW